MNVKELIEKLQKVNPETNVFISLSGMREDGRHVYWTGIIDCVWIEESEADEKWLYIGEIESASEWLTIKEL